MAGRNRDHPFSKLKFNPHWLLFILVLSILILSSLAFIQPISSDNEESTPSPTGDAFMGEGTPPIAAETPQVGIEESPPTPEEIGYTDGIIFFSTVLILILLVGTLREVIRRKGQ